MESEPIPAWLARWGDIAWRLIAIGVVVFFGFRALTTISVVILAFIVAMFLAAVLWKPSSWLRARGFPPALATLLTLTGAVAVIAGIVTLIVPQVANNIDTLADDVGALVSTGRDWLVNGPLGLTEAEINEYWETFVEWAQTIGGDSLLGGATAVIEVVTGTALAVVITFFLLKDGRKLVDGLEHRLAPQSAERVETGFRVGRNALSQYMGGIAIIGFFDALFIGLALWLVGAPLVFPLAVIVFFGAYIPLVGAFVSGLLAVAVAFVSGGFTDALIILVVTVAVQQIEGDVLMPLVFGQTLRLHPLVVLLGVTAGGFAFGLFGAFLAVPVIAVAVAIHEAVAEDPESGMASLARG